MQTQGSDGAEVLGRLSVGGFVGAGWRDSRSPVATRVGSQQGLPCPPWRWKPYTLCSATAAEASPVALGAVPGPKSDSMENLFVPKYPLISGLLKYNGHPAKLPCLCSQFYISEQTYIVL